MVGEWTKNGTIHLDRLVKAAQQSANAIQQVFLLFLFGMVIHWLPTNTKRRYRICFARMPLWCIWLAIVGTVFLAYQFVTAEMQPFIYFQF